jgi:molybdenum cofactor cytidylyltransferase
MASPLITVAALLAAGGGSRYAGPTHKLLADLSGRTVFDRSLEAVRGAGFDRVVVVTGAVALDIPGSSPDVTIRHNPQWADGQASSLQLAIRVADEFGADAVTIGLADQPFVTTDAWRAVRDAPADCRIVVADYPDGTGPNPVRLHRSVWPLLPTDGDEGARSVIRDHSLWTCRVTCVGSVADIDTLEDLERWRSC